MTQPVSIKHDHAPARPQLLALVLAMLLGGCAGLPAPQPQSAPKPIDHYASAQSLAGPALAWPADDWWRAYGDTQLNALVDEALAGSPDLAVAQARLAQAEAQWQVAGGAGQPQLAANVSVQQQKRSYHHLSPSAATPRGWNDEGRATLDFNWEIDFWGRNRAALAAATSELEATRAELAQARLVLATALVSTYAELARQHAALKTAEAAREVRARTAELFRHRHDNGLETRASVRQVEARLASAEAERLAIEEQIALQRHRIAALLGAGPDRGLGLAAPGVDLARPLGLPAELAAQLVGRRPDIVAARQRAEAAAHRIDQSRAAFYPNVNLVAFAGVQSLGLNMLTQGGSTIGGIGPALSLPIFDGGRLRGQLRGAEAEYAAAVADYDRTVVRALQDVADAAVSRQALGGQLARSSEAVEAAREAWDLQRQRYTGGLANYLDVLAAEDTLLGNLRSQIDLQSRAFVLDVALVRALGGGYATRQS